MLCLLSSHEDGITFYFPQDHCPCYYTEDAGSRTNLLEFNTGPTKCCLYDFTSLFHKLGMPITNKQRVFPLSEESETVLRNQVFDIGLAQERHSTNINYWYCYLRLYCCLSSYYMFIYFLKNNWSVFKIICRYVGKHSGTKSYFSLYPSPKHSVLTCYETWYFSPNFAHIFSNWRYQSTKPDFANEETSLMSGQVL